MSSTAAQNKFERIANAVGLSESAKSWLIAAVDPFHDEPIANLRGIPDGTNSNSIVQIVKSSTSIKCPAGVTAGTWDCHIQSLPITQDCSQRVGLTPYSKVTGNTLGTWIPNTATTNPGNVGSITINSGPTGTNIGVFGGNPAANVETKTMNPAFNYVGGTYRLISKGYEAISAGPQLYKSGVVFTYGLPVANSDITENLLVYGKDEAGNPSSSSRNAVRLPDTPLNSSECLLIPGSQSWPAKEGTYMVDRLNDPAVATFSSQGVVGYCINGSVEGTPPVTPASMGSRVSWLLVDPAVTNADYSNVSPGFTAVKTAENGADIQKFNMSGCFFSGLNLQDVIVVNAIWYIERFPDDTNRDLLVLAKPTPHYEPQALDMYSVIMGEMPYGMVQKANGFGDFFKDVVDVVSSTVAPALAALPGTAGIVGKVGTVGGKILGGLLGGGGRKDAEKVNPPNAYSENGKQQLFLEEPVRKIHEVKNSQPKKKKKNSMTSLLKKVSLASKKGKKKSKR